MEVRGAIASNQPAGALPGGLLLKALIIANPLVPKKFTCHAAEMDKLR
jgi:hypothetical protein